MALTANHRGGPGTLDGAQRSGMSGSGVLGTDSTRLTRPPTLSRYVNCSPGGEGVPCTGLPSPSDVPNPVTTAMVTGLLASTEDAVAAANPIVLRGCPAGRTCVAADLTRQSSAPLTVSAAVTATDPSRDPARRPHRRGGSPLLSMHSTAAPESHPRLVTNGVKDDPTVTTRNG